MKVVQYSDQVNLDRTRSWQSTMEANFKTCFTASTQVVNRVGENLRVFGKFVGALDQ